MLDWSLLSFFLLITARMSGFVIFNPLLGRRNIPGIFRVGFVLVLSVSVASVSEPNFVVPNNLWSFAFQLLLEIGLGYLMGTVFTFFFYIPQLAGEVVDTQMGMTMNQIYDPGTQSNMSVTGQIINALMMLLFFAANGHHTLLRILMTTGDAIPYGGVSLNLAVLQAMPQLFIECTFLAVKLCMPILAAELLGQIGMGILMKVIPQINVFAINIELKVIIGLGLLLILIYPISEFLLEIEMQMLKGLEEVIGLMAG